MTKVEATLVYDEKMGWFLYLITVGGLTLCTITGEKGQKAVDRFVAAAQPHADELFRMLIEQASRRAWNVANQRQAKDWPVFSQLEKLQDQIQTAADELKDI